MEYGKAFAALMRMDEAAWARHANPWSGWTRIATMPVLTLAIWSRVWIGSWALLPCAALVVWIWLNPRLFPPIASKQAWVTKGVWGEKLWLEMPRAQLPRQHRRLCDMLNALAGLALLPYAWGLWHLQLWPTVFGLCLTILAKLWFIDRCVWLYEAVNAGSLPGE
ncbi:MAG: DUF6653 family protein [Pseudomonadota bacterium]